MKGRFLVVCSLGIAALTACEAPATGTSGPPATAAVEMPETPAIEAIVRAAYQKPDGPYVWTEGGEPHRLADSINTMEARISGDGQAVSYRKDWELYAIRIDERKPVLLLDRAYLDTLTPADGGFVTVGQFGFSVEGRYLYFNTTAANANPAGPQNDLFRLNVDGSAPEQIFAPGEGGVFTFSPDGGWVALYHPHEIVLARPDGKDARPVFAFDPDAPMGSEGPQIVWAQDSTGFSVLAYGARAAGPQPMTVWFVPVQGEAVERMTFQGYPGASLSPDGGKVIYFDRHEGTTDVHHVDSLGKDTLYASLGESVSFMEWAPDSQRFILNYTQYREDSPVMLTVPYVCAPGEAPVRLTDTPTAYPAYWVDNRRVLLSGEDGRLVLQELGKTSMPVDSGLSINDFDFTLMPGD
jgi:hypothetical protein